MKNRKLSKTGIWFFGIMLFAGLILAAMDFQSMMWFVVSKAVAVAFILVSGEFLINDIEK